ncbi:MAG: secretin N-terminal domain-containing protein [Thermoguttaceae bacterium]|jgi:type II secretory pathway component GspD/PulD (secretin)
MGDDEKPAVSGGSVQFSATSDSGSETKAQPDADKSGEQPAVNAEKPGEGAIKALPPQEAKKPSKPGEPSGRPEGMPGKAGDQPGKPGDTPPGKPGDAAKPEEPKSIQHPTKPPKPPDPEELKVRPDADGKLQFNFNNQPWQPVLEWLADRSSMSLDWQELPGDYLNLKSRQRYTVRETRDLINLHLLARGYTLLCNGEVLSVANIKKLDPSRVPRVTPEGLDNRDPHEFVKVSFPLDWLMADVIIEELNPIKSPNGKLTPLKSTNRLEALDAVINLREIRALLSDVQSADNQQRLVREFVLQYARASEVLEQLQTLLGPDAKGEGTPGMPGGPNQPGGDNPQQQAMMMARMQQQQQQQQQQGGQPGAQGAAKPKQVVMLVLNQRRNSILAKAPPDKMAIIIQAVSAIDVPLDTTQSLLTNVNRMQVYRITGVDPEPVVKTLQEIGNLDPTTRLQIDKKNKAIVAYASLADHVTIRSVVEKLSGSERKFEVIRLRRLAADYVAGSITFMMLGEKKEKPTRQPYWMDYGNQSSNSDKDKSASEFRVEADVDHNRLLLWANEVELGEVENLLVKLGEIPPKGSRRDTVRMIDVRDGKEGEELLERIRRAWPSIAPNPLLVNPAPEADKTPPKPSKEELPPPEPATKSAGARAMESDALKFVQFSRAGASVAEPKESFGKTPPAVEIKMDAEGHITISSEDIDALDSIEELAAQLAAPRKGYKVFKLKYAWAYTVALNLEDFFMDDDKKDSRSNILDYIYGYGGQDDSKDTQNRLSKRRPLKFISDSESNTILVENADAAQLKTIGELIDLYDKQPDDSQSARKTETVHLQYSKAKVVAETIKDVYRDLLSANDKALQGAKPNDRDSGRMYIYEFSSEEDGKKDQKMPKFKGQLSIGIDELSNSLVVSAPAYLFDQVHKMINDLDQAAAPTSTIKVVKLGQGVTSQQAREALSDILGDGTSKSKTSSQAPKRPETNNKQPSKGNNNKSSGNSSTK